ncbi:MAG TPA: 16S rRNA (guanine(527)-N(7))-methyltransferase RsmG [Betaproteobacteria bacterium]|nr:16S rRNA (guanine(527)-N(7))-methyltransferase RsmG [Betaproteobacteria bacterium]
MTLEQELSQGIAALNIAVDAEARLRLLQYLSLLHKWNKVYNLTAIREPRKMLTHHLLDSLAVVPYLSGDAIADIGSGAGLPGIPLALARPDWSMTLVESNHKKAAFLTQACIELKLTNAQVIVEHVEAFNPQKKFSMVISRAFSALAEFVELAGHLCAADGRLIAMKGVYPYDELESLPANIVVDRVISLKIPGLEAERHLVIMGRNEWQK